jgi:membrane associated rhomboid family serine protease
MGIYDRSYYQDDDLQPLRAPWSSRSVVSTLIIINAAVQVLNFVLGRANQIVQFLSLHPSDLSHPLSWYRFLTYGFAHSQDIMHIVFNMLTLFFLGQAVEQKYGKQEFLRIYLVSIVVCGLAWAVSHGLSRGSSGMSLIGASGAVTTIAMLFVFSFPHAILRIWGVIPVKAWVVGIIIVGANLLGNSQVNVNGGQQIAYDVHLFGAGFAAIYFFSGWNFSTIPSKLRKFQQYLPFAKTGLKVHRPSSGPDISPNIQREADRILDKIHKNGQDSLTKKEKLFLEKYSRNVREHRSRSRR